MADSDHSTTMPSVTNGKTAASNRVPDTDPAILLLRDWLRAQYASQVLCRLQQRLERRYLDARGSEVMDKQVDYSIACQAEVEATTVALKIQDRLPRTPARTLLGIVAKLEIIVGADPDIDDPTDFPWPHIESILRDLKEIAESAPLKRPDRSIVQADCRRYQATAADLIGLGRRAANLTFGQQAAAGVDTE